jgi:hypothetical protein
MPIASLFKDHLRQLPVVLQLILQRRQLLDDALPLLGLLCIGDRAHCAGQVINGTSLH